MKNKCLELAAGLHLYPLFVMEFRNHSYAL